MSQALQRLSTGRDRYFRLYDPQELLDLDSKVASGYVVLLSGGYPTATTEKQKKKGENNGHSGNEPSETVGDGATTPKLDRGSLNLAFLAIIEGNVVDACFGVKPHMSADSNRRLSQAAKLSNDAKTIINEAVRSSDGVREIAVTAYSKAFHIAIQYNDDIKKLNFITRCYKWKPILRKAEQSLVEAFKPLNEAVDASS